MTPRRMAVYTQVSQQIRGFFQCYINAIEPLLLSEVYLDVTNLQAQFLQSPPRRWLPWALESIKYLFVHSKETLMIKPLLMALACSALIACQSAYYSAAEKVGIHKRDILVDRVEESRDAQKDAEEEFQSALEQFSVLVNFDGGELQDVYENLSGEYDDAKDAADKVTARINAVEHVAEALFDEWEDEIDQYSNQRLRANSQGQLRDTRKRYAGMIKAMRKAEAKMPPVLTALHDNVLYLKHNLNARAVASLKTEFRSIEQDVARLVSEMRRAIASSDAFIQSMSE